MHKAKMIIPALVVTMLALPAMAHEDEYYDSARVISVTPQTERVNSPVEACHAEYVRESSRQSTPATCGRAPTWMAS